MQSNAPITAPDVPSYSRIVPCTPRRPQSVAALLPEEILDVIFGELEYDYSTPSGDTDRLGRSGNLSHMSVVAEGWTRPARRLLFRTVKVAGWKDLQEPVGDWVGQQVRRLEIALDELDGVESGEIGRTIVVLLKKLPNLRHLSLIGYPGSSPFYDADFSPMRSTVLLPRLSELEITNIASPGSIIFALLASSGHRICRLSVHCYDYGAGIDPLAGAQRLDFRGNLRYLSTGGAFYQSMLDPTQVALDGLGGLEELRLSYNTAVETTQREGGLIRTIAPTLRTLTIHPKKAAWLTDFPAPLSKITRLEIINYDAIPLPSLRRLPPALTSLHFTFDDDIHAAFALWTAAPALVPASLKSIGFTNICNITTFQQVPRVDTLHTHCTDDTVRHLRQLTPGTLPFKTLKIKFLGGGRPIELNSVTAECQRLGLVFCWDHDT